MSRASIYALTFLAVVASAAFVRAQAPPAGPPCQKSDKPPGNAQEKPQSGKDTCAPSSQESPATQKFPFPGEPAPSKTEPQPDAPSAPAPSGKEPPAADKFPFPTSVAPPMPGSEPGSSSSSSSSSSADDPADTPAADKPPLNGKGDQPRPSGRRRLPKVEKLQSDEERAEEDLKISKFYENAGNLNAAYLRAVDAVKYLPSDAETHFALAHVAEKLKKREEAIAEYNNYLQLAPDGLRIKQAHKALEDLQH